jgi:hypothetical protein
MRTAFLVLLLANVAFFAYARFGANEAGGETQILAQQLNPEKIKLLAPGEQAGAPARRPEPPKVDPPKIACIEWGAFSAADAPRAAQALEPLGLGAKLAQRRVEEVANYWVYIPPLANRQLATQKASELKRLGVEEYFVVPDDPKWRFAVSLGIFKTEDAAKARLNALRAKGVKSAVVGARDTQLSKVYFQVREADAGLAAKLNELKPDFPASEVRECANDEKKA